MRLQQERRRVKKYSITVDEETKKYFSHQAKQRLEASLLMFDNIKQMEATLVDLSTVCRRTILKEHTLIESFKNDFNHYDVLIGATSSDEEVEESVTVKEEEESEDRNENNDNCERDTKINDGDLVTLDGGTRWGDTFKCYVVKVSDSRKTAIVQDLSGNRFRKNMKNLRKLLSKEEIDDEHDNNT